MTKIGFDTQGLIKDEAIKYAVIAARYDGKWIFCKHKQRDTWEMPGGHREKGETTEQTAKRELYEETGVDDAEIIKVCDYSAETESGTGYGALYFAQVRTPSKPLAEFEIEKTELFLYSPENLTYPEIQPYLFERVQGWLNLQSKPGEIWDVYDAELRKTGRTHRRGDPLAPGDYHLTVHIWIRNAKGEFLLTKRTPNKGFPNMWESTGGSALAGDDSLTAALRETEEETGITLDKNSGRKVLTYSGLDYFCDVWLFEREIDLKQVRFQENETCDAMLASKETVLRMKKDGTLVPFSYIERFFGMI